MAVTTTITAQQPATTTTRLATATPAPKSQSPPAVERGLEPDNGPANPKDSMKSTWPFWDRSKWKLGHKLVNALDVYPNYPGVDPPKFKKTDPVPHMPQWSQQAYILTFAWIPFALQQLWTWAVGPMSPIGITVLYTTLYEFVLIHEIRMIRSLGYKYGYLDGDVAPRDGIPDVGVSRIIWSLYKTVGGRLLVFSFLAYDRAAQPLDVMTDPKWFAWTWLKAGIYAVVLDFWFYVYHRAMHDIKPLWKYHRTHHLTKHPNPALSAYADDEQEVFDMIVIPILSYFTMQALGLKLDWYQWWVCQQFIMFAEVMGHSGLRLHLTAPSPFGWLLRKFDMELVLEDHDIHHRKGYRKSFNYGKQSRVWDTLFGTTHPRIESYEANIDYKNKVYMPIFFGVKA